MGLEELENRIKEDGRKQIDEINKEADEKIEKIREGINTEADIKASKILKDGESEAKLIYRRIIADAVIRNKDKVERERNTIIDEVFNKARKKILDMDNKGKKDFLNKLIDNDKDKVPEPEILVDKKYASLVKGAKASNLGDFGVIIQSKDGRVRIDNTLNNRLERLKVTLRPQISSILFK